MANLKVSEGINITEDDYGNVINPAFEVGDIVAYHINAPFPTPPSGWVECNGQELSKTTYSALSTIIGTKYGETNGSGGVGTTHFRVPKMNDSTLTTPFFPTKPFQAADPASSSPVAHTHSLTGVASTTGSSSSPTMNSFSGHTHSDTITHNNGTLPAHSHNVTNTTITSNSAATSNTGNLQIINTGTNYEVALSTHYHSDTFPLSFNTAGSADTHLHSGGSSVTTGSVSQNDTHSHTSTLSFTFPGTQFLPPFLTTRFIIKV
jgi:microcystin-dependent protein